MYKLLPILCLFFCLAFKVQAQQFGSPKTIKNITLSDSVTTLDSLPILPSSFVVYQNEKIVPASFYELNFVNSKLKWKNKLPVNLRIEYSTLNFDLSLKTQTKDTNIITPYYEYKNPFRITTELDKKEVNLLGLNSLTKSGSISRGISVGNNQNLAVNSNFNLQLSGKISNNIGILASITDNNIPIQPDGNTQQLQDFDQVFIQLFQEDNWQLTAGDFLTTNTNSYFMRYAKKGKGISFEKTFNTKDSNLLFSKTDLAISRGKFATNTIQGIEGNQGPYKLVGAQNELTIVVLSGTEQVFIDGKLLKRGIDQDYTIDYNSAEVTFTAKQLITKNKRIVIQFQYSDQNYIRSLANTQLKWESKKWKSAFQFYSEQDHKNQPLQQTLNDPEKQVLFNAGDDINAAVILREDSIVGSENAVLYEKTDSLGYTIYQVSNNEDSVRFRLRFSNVGNGNGDYIQEGFSAFGRVYKWVKPDTVGGQIIKNGNYDPVILLIAPKRKQLITFDNEFILNKNASLQADLALSNNDLNTFSPVGNNNNVGLGARLGFNGKKQLQNTKNPWVVSNKTNVEFISPDFDFIERYRPVEFSRNWNILGQTFHAPQILGYSTIGLSKNTLGSLNYTFNLLNIDGFYNGNKHNALLNINTKPLDILYDGSYLTTQSNQQTNFYRHKSKILKKYNKLQLGYEDETETNLFLLNDSLLGNSYQFYEGMFFIGNGDSSSANYKFYGKYRNEKNSQNQTLTQAAFSNDLGVNYTLISKNKRTKLVGNTAYRKLTITDTTLGRAPDNTFVSQTDFSTSLLKQLFQLNTYYEIGSGLEQRREYVYIEVNSGQGTYAWIDYNDNGIKELNEFEVARFQDQADYIRVFTQSNTYITAYTNKFSQSVRIEPRRLIKRDVKSGGLKFLRKLSSLTAYKVDRKTTQSDFVQSLNPLLDKIADSNLLSINKQVRSTLFFNRTGYKYGLSYGFQDTRSKVLLLNGFDSRQHIFHELKARYKQKKVLFNWDNTIGNKQLTSDFTASRNYDIQYLTSVFKTTYQKSANQFFNVSYTFTQKDNVETEFASIHIIGTEATYNIINNINLNARVNYLNISYNGSENSSLAYEMLEGLKRGNNFTWEVLLNKKIAKNLSLTLNYNGRKPEGTKTIHSGTVEMRAFF